VELRLKLKNSILLLVTLAVLSVLVCGSIVNAGDNSLKGTLHGKKWNLSVITLKKKSINGVPVLVLELFGKEASEAELCKDIDRPDTILIQIPLTSGYKLEKVAPDYDSASIQLDEIHNSNVETFYFHRLELNEEELNAKGLAFVSGKLQIVSPKAKTDINGTFKARVCNLEQNI
jgi:hypothetical protein